MAALTHPVRLFVRAAEPGEGAEIAALWRELWDAHEEWGGYPGSQDARVYAQVAHRLDDDARMRAGHPILGRHIHLVADWRGRPCGQVEGWFDRHGAETSTPFTCEVRSLIVTAAVRRLSAGRALLSGLADLSRVLARGTACVMAAEVLEPNPAHGFYARVGYAPVSWNARIEAVAAAAPVGPVAARVAGPQDAVAIARLEAILAARRRRGGDLRFDEPRPIDAKLVGAIASHFSFESPASLREPATLVAVDPTGTVRGAASFTAHALNPPFVPSHRALLGRFALDTSCPAGLLVRPLVALGCKLARSHGVLHVELTDLPAPGTELHDAALATGARAWSRVVTKLA